MSDRPLSTVSARDAWLADALQFFADHGAHITEERVQLSYKPGTPDDEQLRRWVESIPDDWTIWPEVDWTTGEQYWPHEPNTGAP